ncbi:hypothetical protein NQ314_004263 [Rhamnusium bicolor]|uniref:Fas-associated factor 1/2-like UAS domain-containing protein n=1 Tax=Rhamnusium bicolor TaxID=1586634 RepID=A0AAV8ZJY1_9CUCU|nr:hypothetical protein NQ314_004263 [Rhamnusium bicolor]
MSLHRKSLLLYLHNGSDPFSTIFCENLKKPEIIEILNRNFFLLGWDVEETKYQSALVQALNNCSTLSNLVNMINSKVSAALCILPIEGAVTLFSCLRGNVSYKDFHMTLTNAERFLITEREEEKLLEDLKRKTANKNDMGSENYQKLMADMLGDRDYDSFEFNQHEHLKNKIAFALLGPPQKRRWWL